ncbi:autotransporter outer membrane beta-barrel domain-containing protein [Citrobacter sp. FP75]|uniref:autotransporter outer membrane beta-barrel domain-containing protein n=1 Tax=Citrobacter sp. FP75 TaxID=1852949 RepID=UPI001BC9D550|nr:autotransporter outer membrane beta-barrel domain-containing protein [Citrobacter sp. FP75]
MSQTNVAFSKKTLVVSILLAISGTAIASDLEPGQVSGLNWSLLQPNSGSGDTAVPGIYAWNFNNTQAEIFLDANSNKGNIYFNPPLERLPQRTVNVADLDLRGYYINFSKTNIAENNSILNMKNASVDFIESGGTGSDTNIAISLKGTHINGAQMDANYDNALKNGAAKNKNWIANQDDDNGYGVYVDFGDTGNITVDIDNSQLGSENWKAGIFTGGSDSVDITASESTLYGSVQAGLSQDVSIELTKQTTLTGNIITGDGVSNVSVNNNSKVLGDINVSQSSEALVSLGDNVATGNVNKIIGNKVDSTLQLGEEATEFDGRKFVDFTALDVQGKSSIINGLNDVNVGPTLKLTGNHIIADVNLAGHGQLTVADKTTLQADNLSLGGDSSLTINKGTLQTSSAQLFTDGLGSHGLTAAATGLNATGKKVTFSDGTLALSDALFNFNYVKSVNGLVDNAELIMLGNMVSSDGTDPTGIVDFGTAGSVGENTLLAGVTVESTKSEIVIGGDKPSTGQDGSINSIGVKNIVLAASESNTASVTVKGYKTLTLTGDATGKESTNLISAGEGANISVNVTEGTLQLGHTSLSGATGSLNAGVNLDKGNLQVAGGKYNVTGDIAASNGSTINIADSAALQAAKIEMTDTNMQVNGTLQTASLTANTGTTINVGTTEDKGAAGHLLAENVNLNGASLFLDPQWNADSTIAQASKAALQFIGDSIDGKLTAGQNALLVLGEATTEWAEAQFAKTGQQWSEEGITAALAINAPQLLDETKGSLVVDGSLTSVPNTNANTATFADNSLLMVNGKAIADGQYALTAESGNLNVSDSARLYIADAQARQTYYVVDGFNGNSPIVTNNSTHTGVSDKGWNGENLLTNRLLIATRHWDEKSGQLQVTTAAKSAADALPGVALTQTLDTMMALGINDTQSHFAGSRFLARAIDNPYVSTQDIVKTINSAAQLAVAGGVQNTTLSTGLSASGTILDRNSILNSKHQPNAGSEGLNFWASTLYGHDRTHGFSTGALDTGNNVNFFGLMVGADITHEISLGHLRSGLAFHSGTGKSSSKGDLQYTKNDVDFWGATFYENWTNNNFSVTVDLGLSNNSNDVEQNLPAYVDMGSKLKADIDSEMLTAGITGEYLYSMSSIDIIPHVGLRYIQLKTEHFDTTTQSEENLFETAEQKQNLWQFPVGVRLSTTYSLDSGWAISSQADLSVIPVTGDTHAKTRVRTYGINASDTLSSTIVDDTSFSGQLGVKAQKGNVTFGINYNIDASEHQTGQGAMAVFNYNF